VNCLKRFFQETIDKKFSLPKHKAKPTAPEMGGGGELFKEGFHKLLKQE